MKNQYPRLMRVNRSYYIRVAVPRNLQFIVQKKQFKYSLMTNDYYTALSRLRILSVLFDKILEFYGCYAMQVDKKSKNILIKCDTYDFDKILMERIEEIQQFCSVEPFRIKNFAGISLVKDDQDYKSWGSPERMLLISDFNAAVKYFYDSMLKKLQDKETDISVKRILKKWQNNQATFDISSEGKEDTDSHKDFVNYVSQLKMVERYGRNLIFHLMSKEEYVERNPIISSLLASVQRKKDEKRLKTQFIKRLWNTLFDEFIGDKLTTKRISAKTIKSYKTKLDVCFSLIGKKCVQDVTSEDCKNIRLQLGRVPSNWMKKYPDKKLVDVLLPPGSQSMSDKTLQTYIILFKDYMKYAFKNVEGMTLDVGSYVLIPKISKKSTRLPFDDEDLKKLFNAETYPSRYKEKSFAKFWIPVIALYSGARVNEISQLKVEDIIKFDGVYCFYFTDEGDGQSLKNESSKRIVPIHSELIKLGFLDFVDDVKKKKKDRVFYTLNRTEHSNYGDTISKWFGVYRRKVGIVSKNKTLHSMRHNVETKLVNNNISETIQNSICGWSDKGVGQRVYAKKEIKTLQSAIETIKYEFWDDVVDNLK